MGVVITRDDIIAYAEVDYIIHHMNEKYINKVPEKLLNFFGTIKDPEHIVNVNPRVPLQNQNLKRYTLELLALLHLKYWCEDEERRKMLYEKMLDNQRKLDSQMREKYNIDNMFEMNSAKVVNSEENLTNHKSAFSEENNATQVDYSIPKNITKYDSISEQNPDVNDYTDVEENKLNKYFSTETNEINKLEEEEKAIMQKAGFLINIINKIKNIFSKKQSS